MSLQINGHLKVTHAMSHHWNGRKRWQCTLCDVGSNKSLKRHVERNHKEDVIKVGGNASRFFRDTLTSEDKKQLKEISRLLFPG